MIKRVFTVLLLILALGFLPVYAATDIWDVGSWKIDSTGALIPASGSSLKVLYEEVNAGDTLVTADSGKLITYTPAIDATAATFNLPTADEGMEYSLSMGKIGRITVNPAGFDKIRYLTLDSGDSIVGPAATGDSVILTCSKAHYWTVKSMFGAWTDGS